MSRPLYPLLRTVFEEMERELVAQLRQEGFDDLHPAQLAVLQEAPEGVSPSELASRLRISKQALNHLLGQLEGRGYLAREEGPDARTRRVRLTERGRAAAAASRSSLQRIEEHWGYGLGERGLESLAAQLARVVRMIEEG